MSSLLLDASGSRLLLSNGTTLGLDDVPNTGEPVVGPSPSYPIINEPTLHQPTVTVRVYDPSTRDGIRQRDLSVYTSGKFTRERNTVGTFELVVPLVARNRDVLEQIKIGWLFEFWSDEQGQWLFGGYATRLRWGFQDGTTSLTVSGVSYLGWLGQRRLIGGTGSKAWAATLGGLETPTDHPAVNEIMYAALTYDPYSINPPGARSHPSFRIPRVFPVTHVDDRFSTPTMIDPWAIPRPANTEITAFMSGIEAMDYLSGLVGDRVNEDPSSQWFGMPRLSYDIVRYTGPTFLDGSTPWPSLVLYLVIKAPGLGTNRTVGSSSAARPVVFDVEGGGISAAEYIEDAGDVKNFEYVLGVGEQATRARYTYSDVESIDRYGLIEDVVDAGQEANLNVIDQKGKDALNDKRNPKVSARFTISMLPHQVYGRDFFFDDAVTVYWGSIGLVLNDFITSVTLTMGGGNDGSLGIQQTDIVVGSEKLSRDSAVLGRYLSGLKRGITNLRV